ncbi:MAG: hypothetical protein ACKO2P_04580 [Planctomycetota bacterium]
MPTKPVVDAIRVRMYRQGFGDCFLLSFMSQGEKVYSLLIDCGIKLNTSRKEVPPDHMLSDLRTELTPPGASAPALDALVATHEHWDHIAFFHPSRQWFDDFQIGSVWMGWTEDPQDREAVQINSRLRSGVRALQEASRRLQQATHKTGRTRQSKQQSAKLAARLAFNDSIADVGEFYGLALKSESGIHYNPNAKISTNTQEAMEHLTRLAQRSGGGARYLSPGTLVPSRDLPKGVRVYVLGPPRNTLLNKSNPSGGANKETYFGPDGNGLAGFMQALDTHAATSEKSGDPFRQRDGIPMAAMAQDPWYRRTYLNQDEQYRTIDDEWLSAAARLALQLDGAVNNTSLVIAIEIIRTGSVLLFPGDAQVGSWLSWHKHEWTVGSRSRARKVTASELLNRTVLYKVSHHGSHNATLKGQGLEMMTHPDLVAMIPEQEDSYAGILDPELLDALHRRCRGRVIVSADRHHDPEDLLQNKPPQLSAAEWKRFLQQLTVNRVFVEYTVT